MLTTNTRHSQTHPAGQLILGSHKQLLLVSAWSMIRKVGKRVGGNWSTWQLEKVQLCLGSWPLHQGSASSDLSTNSFVWRKEQQLSRLVGMLGNADLEVTGRVPPLMLPQTVQPWVTPWHLQFQFPPLPEEGCWTCRGPESLPSLLHLLRCLRGKWRWGIPGLVERQLAVPSAFSLGASTFLFFVLDFNQKLLGSFKPFESFLTF